MSLANNNVVAIYARLSREDEKDYLAKDGASKSIENQIKTLKEYVEKNNMILFDTYIDDGCSGRDFNRKEFIRMIDDMEHKRINCIIVKDLSRFGRNYVLTGRYIDEILPYNDIRFISVSDRYDSAFSKPGDMSIVIKNFLNDLYLRECRKKARLTLDRKSKNGFVANRIPYGYEKDIKKKVIIDEEPASVIRKIFGLRKEGMNKAQIAKTLEKEQILTPTYHRYKKNKKPYNKLNGKPYSWDSGTIAQILRNYEYCGHAVNLTTRYVKGKKRGKREDFIIVRNTHPAIISEDDFIAAQEKDIKREYTSRKHLRIENVYCSKCNKKMLKIIKYSKKGDYFVYKCKCCEHKIKMNVLHDIVYEETINTIKQISNNIDEAKELLRNRLNLSSMIDLKKLNKDKESIQREMKKAFENKIVGVISEQKYKDSIGRLKEQVNLIDEKVIEYKRVIERNKLFEEKFDEFVQNIDKINDDKLETIRLFVDSVYIDENKIIPRYKFE